MLCVITFCPLNAFRCSHVSICLLGCMIVEAAIGDTRRDEFCRLRMMYECLTVKVGKAVNGDRVGGL